MKYRGSKTISRMFLWRYFGIKTSARPRPELRRTFGVILFANVRRSPILNRVEPQLVTETDIIIL